MAVEARCRGLLSDGGAAEEHFREAIDPLTSTPLRLDLARTRLVYGEWLRRERRPAEAPATNFRVAHQMFTEFGLEGFTERARVELRATGEQVRKRTTEASSELTPREAQIAELAAARWIEPGDRGAAVHQLQHRRVPPPQGVPEAGGPIAGSTGGPRGRFRPPIAPEHDDRAGYRVANLRRCT